ncbi:MAG: PBS lyase [Deltaproteobacteria bacterium]|nr:PBS lyase [Deltaproteobacteria bacterium]MBW2137302.1 PBS lyase [Deltaproteobacteria bacterium]
MNASFGKFAGKDVVKNPTCPFCNSPLERPVEDFDQRLTEMPVGLCPCGAAFACDVTGHNLGTAMIEALVCACEGDWDKAWELTSGKDYQEEILQNYDLANHLIVPAGAYEGRRIAGALYFIRLYRHAKEDLEGTGQRRMENPGPETPEHPAPERRTGKLSKKHVETLVNDFNVDRLMEAALNDKSVLRHIKRLLYSADRLTRFRAADALGRVCGKIAPVDPGPVTRLLQGFFSSLSDTAASSWGAIDAIGEILGNSPEQFDAYVPQLYHFLRDRELLIETLRALGHIGQTHPQLMRKDAIHFIQLLYDRDPSVRGYATILVGHLGTLEAREALERLREDGERVEIYSDGNIETTTIGKLASLALEKLA